MDIGKTIFEVETAGRPSMREWSPHAEETDQRKTKVKLFRLHFGCNINGRPAVSEENVSTFLRNVVSREFNGFSVSYGSGYWKGTSELSFFVDVIAEDTAAVQRSIWTIAAAYNTEFKQESVLVTVSDVSAVFYSDRIQAAA